MAKIAINGFGRIGRLFLRAAFANAPAGAKALAGRSAGQGSLEIVAINDLGNLENLAYLLRYDTVYGRYDREIKIEKSKIKIDGKEVLVFQEKDPAKLPWKDLGIDFLVII